MAGSQRSHTVGVILPSMANPFYHAFPQGVEEVVCQDSTMLFVYDTHDNEDEALRYFAQLTSKHVDGIIVGSHDVSQLLTPGSGLLEPGLSVLPFATVAGLP